MDSSNVAQHYDSVRQVSRRKRERSVIINLRNFNNWLKAVLINLHTRPGYSVLDLCCGKGGDLRKWEQAKIVTYVGCDIAEVSVRQAAERYNRERTPCTFKPVFLVGDMFEHTISDYLHDDTQFDVVSCQFAMHYAFESEARVRQLLHNVTERLRAGGFFIGTTVDANVLVRKLRATDGLEVGNEVFRAVFDDAFQHKRFARDAPYGIRYHFSLGEQVKDCPEFLVHFPTFEKLAAEYGLELTLNANFHDFFLEFGASHKYKHFHELFFRMNVQPDSGAPVPTPQWDAIYLYTAFAFKKVGADPSPGHDPEQVDALAEEREDATKQVVIMNKSNGA